MKPYQYVVLRCVPRVEREEFLNLGVVLYCQAEGFLDVGWHVDDLRLRSMAPALDVDGVRDALEFVSGVCRGEAEAGAAAATDLGTRFGFLKAPRSTVVQPGPVHGGLTADPAVELARLVDCLVR
jgi:hypothetical protein